MVVFSMAEIAIHHFDVKDNYIDIEKSSSYQEQDYKLIIDEVRRLRCEVLESIRNVSDVLSKMCVTLISNTISSFIELKVSSDFNVNIIGYEYCDVMEIFTVNFSIGIKNEDKVEKFSYLIFSHDGKG